VKPLMLKDLEWQVGGDHWDWASVPGCQVLVYRTKPHNRHNGPYQFTDSVYGEPIKYGELEAQCKLIELQQRALSRARHPSPIPTE
jgi:hypothetical protein